MNALRKEDIYDQAWRLNNLYLIKTKEGEIEPFRMNWAQEQMFSDLWYNNLVLKVRQIGSTTFWCLFALDSAIFNRSYAVGINAHEREAAEDIFDRNIKFPYENLPDSIRNSVKARKDNVRQLNFSNDSMVVVGTSLRGGTYQLAIITEFGKTCAKFPHKAKEIVTGTLEAVGQGNITVIESTAEGNEGYFYDYCQAAKALQDAGKKLTKADFRLHFLPWMCEPAYRLTDEDTESTIITADDHKYFDVVQEGTGIEIDKNQRAWYVKKRDRLGPDMKREYPSTPKEAFEQSIEGSYYGEEIRRLRAQHRICSVPVEMSVPVNTFWDLGRNDTTAIWFHQQIGLEHRFIDYYERNGEGLAHYAKVLQQKGYLWGEHYLPHDVEVTELTTNKNRRETLEQGGVRPIRVVTRIGDINEGIEMTRQALPRCWFDETRCKEGIKALENYRKEWDEKRGTFRMNPLHNWASNGADAFRQFAQGYNPQSDKPRPAMAVMRY